MVQPGPGRCNIKFVSVPLVQGVPSHPFAAQRAPAHPKASQAIPNFQLRNEKSEISGEISQLGVNWMVQDFPGRPTPAHASSDRFIELGGSPLTQPRC